MTQQQTQKPLAPTTDATGKSSITGGKDASNSGANANPAIPASSNEVKPKADEAKTASTATDKKSSAA